MRFLFFLIILLAVNPLFGAVKVVNSNFEDGKKHWKFPSGTSIRPLEGRNSSAALHIKRSRDGENIGWTEQSIALEPGKSYKVSCYAKANITKKGKYKVGASFVLTFSNGKKVLGNIYNNGLIESSSGKWVRLEREFTVPQETKTSVLKIGLYNGFLGEAWFDDVNIELSDRYFVYMTTPGNRLIFMDDPYVSVAAVRTGAALAPGTAAELLLKGKDFTIRSIKELDGNQACFELKKLKKGVAEAHLRLLAPDKKSVLAEERFAVNIIEKSAGFRGTYIDKYQRLIVDGKPFMPLGFYIGQMSKEEIDMISEAKFNTLLSYGSMVLRFNYGKPGNPAALSKTLEVMDYCQQKNIKFVFSIVNVQEQGAFAINNWYGTKGADNVVKRVLDVFGKHPALLAWYIADEPPASMTNKLEARRNLVNKYDPMHPSFMVSMHFNELYNFASSGDISGVDPYPVGNRSFDMYDVTHAGRQSAKLGKPFWGVMQCFNLAYYTKTTPENHHKYWHEVHRDPSAEEMRSMCFQLAQFGAKGFIFYYWNCIRDYENRSKDPDYFKKAFGRMKLVASAMKTLEPYLLSVHKIETLPLKKLQGKVMATLHKNDAGKKCVLITAEGPGKAAAELNLPEKFKSLFGKTVFQDGKYIFKAENIASDMLVEE